MNRIDPKQAAIFVSVFIAIAGLINSTQSDKIRAEIMGTPQTVSSAPVSHQFIQPVAPQPQQQIELEKEAASRKAAEDAVAEHTKYLARYLSPSFARKPGTKAFAITVVSENGKFNRAVNAAIASRFMNDSVEILYSFFTPEFVSDGLFNNAFTDASEIFRKLELANTLGGVLLARQQVQYSTNASLQNVITANMQLEVMISSFATPDQPQTWTLTANGAGFNPKDARAMAEERLIKQIANDPKMSIDHLP